MAWLPAWIWIITPALLLGLLNINHNFQWFEYNSLTESLTGYKLDPEDQRSSVSTWSPGAQEKEWLPWRTMQRSLPTDEMLDALENYAGKLSNKPRPDDPRPNFHPILVKEH